MRDWPAWVESRLPALPVSARQRRRVVGDLAALLAAAHEEAAAAGADEDAALRHAERQIPDWDALARDVGRAAVLEGRSTGLGTARRPACRPRRWEMIGDIRQDIRFSLRSLARQPGFALVAVLTLALGIGASTAVFSAVHAVLLRPFPYVDPDRLTMVYSVLGGEIFWTSEPNLQDLRDRSELFEGLGALRYGSTTLLDGGEPERVVAGLASADVFSLLRLKPALGRFFLPDEEAPDSPNVVVLSHELWQRRFGGDPGIVDRTIGTDSSRSPARVVGVLPAGFRLLVPRHTNFPQRIDLWSPYQIDYRAAERFNNNLTILGRLKPGVTLQQSQQELDRIGREIEKQHYPAEEGTFGWKVLPLQADTVGEIRPALIVLLVATGLVMLIACVNVANLLLAHGSARRREFGIRTALGATRGRLLRQSFTESLLLALAGGAAGVFLAWVGVTVLSSYLPAHLPRLDAIRMDARVLAASLGLSVLAGLVFGAVPALRSARSDPDEALVEGGGRQSGGVAASRLRGALTVAEIALSLMLLIGGVLMVRSFVNLQDAETGYRARGTLTFSVSLPSSRYESDEARERFFETVQERLAALPGVESVGGNMLLPFGRSLFIPSFTFYEPGGTATGATVTRSALARPTLPGYFRTLQTRLIEGRFFDRSDRGGGQDVAIIDETLARAIWPGESAIGKRLATGSDPREPRYRTIVGVVENLRLTSLTGERRHQVYLPVGQYTPSTLSYVVRTSLDPDALLGTVRAELRQLDPHLPLWEVGRLDRTLADVMAPERLTSLLMALFAGIGLLLAVVGIYGVISFSVAQRTFEIGIRYALGARRTDIYGIVLRQGVRLTALGVGLGIAGSLALAGTLRSLLFGVSTFDVGSYGAVSLVLGTVALLACWVPARRAGRVDPIVTLRCE